jgi:hypothetical protein
MKQNQVNVTQLAFYGTHVLKESAIASCPEQYEYSLRPYTLFP